MFRYSMIVAVAASVLVITMLIVRGGDDGVSLDPPEIRYGEDISEMGMFVVDPRYTVATLPEDTDEWLLFDDIGELFKYRHEHADAGFQVMWVNDYHAETWLHADAATYLESSELTSPMGWGVAAFEDETDAAALQAEIGGELLSWDDVTSRAWIAPPGPEAHAGHTTGHEPTPAGHDGH